MFDEGRVRARAQKAVTEALDGVDPFCANQEESRYNAIVEAVIQVAREAYRESFRHSGSAQPTSAEIHAYTPAEIRERGCLFDAVRRAKPDEVAAATAALDAYDRAHELGPYAPQVWSGGK